MNNEDRFKAALEWIADGSFSNEEWKLFEQAGYYSEVSSDWTSQSLLTLARQCAREALNGVDVRDGWLKTHLAKQVEYRNEELSKT